MVLARKKICSTMLAKNKKIKKEKKQKGKKSNSTIEKKKIHTPTHRAGSLPPKRNKKQNNKRKKKPKKFNNKPRKNKEIMSSKRVAFYYQTFRTNTKVPEVLKVQGLVTDLSHRFILAGIQTPPVRPLNHPHPRSPPFKIIAIRMPPFTLLWSGGLGKALVLFSTIPPPTTRC